MFSAAAMLLCLSQARGLPVIILFSTAAGLTAELYRPASSALLADLVPAGQRVTAFAAYRMALNAGFAFGSATAGLLAKKSFLWLFAGNATTSLLYGVLAWFALPSGLHSFRAANSILETFRVLRRDRNFLQVLVATLAVGLVFVQVFSTMSLQITRSGFSPVIYGLVISLNGAIILFCELPLTSLTKRFPARWMMALGFLLIGTGFASNGLARTLPMLALTVVLFSFRAMVAMPVAAAFVANLAPEHQRGLYMGTYGMIWALAFVAGPTLGLLLFGINPFALWVICGALGVLAAMIILRD